MVGDAVKLLADLEPGSVDFVATDPPYNPQLKLTMAGGKLAKEFANRRTDYAMVTSDPADLANSATYGEFLDRMEGVLAGLRRVLRDKRYATVIVRDAYQDGRYRFTGADLAAACREGRVRHEGRPGLVPGRRAATAVRLSARVRAEHRAPAHPGATRRVAALLHLGVPWRRRLPSMRARSRHRGSPGPRPGSRPRP